MKILFFLSLFTIISIHTLPAFSSGYSCDVTQLKKRATKYQEVISKISSDFHEQLKKMKCQPSDNVLSPECDQIAMRELSVTYQKNLDEVNAVILVDSQNTGCSPSILREVMKEVQKQ
jgi:hypothetical protein